ncbi:MAG: hypothetical protein M3Y42_13745, partial [Actinomycetota bacterium]|nr:hypothetical protein [Actinomycetota bacterium]
MKLTARFARPIVITAAVAGLLVPMGATSAASASPAIGRNQELVVRYYSDPGHTNYIGEMITGCGSTYNYGQTSQYSV